MITALEAYTKAQKTVGNQFMIIGVVLLLLALLAHFVMTQTTFMNGFKIGSLICGLIILAGGLGYYKFSDTTHQKAIILKESSEAEFLITEENRMQKVAKDYPIYQAVFATFIIIGLVLIFLIKSSFWSGVGISIVILFIGVMVSEYFSKESIDEYLKFLTQNNF